MTFSSTASTSDLKDLRIQNLTFSIYTTKPPQRAAEEV